VRLIKNPEKIRKVIRIIKEEIEEDFGIQLDLD